MIGLLGPLLYYPTLINWTYPISTEGCGASGPTRMVGSTSGNGLPACR